MKIKDVVFEISATKPEHYPETDKEEIVFLGRSNVGKSTFINSFTNKKKISIYFFNTWKNTSYKLLFNK